MSLIRPGAWVTGESSGKTYLVRELLGAGGQGEVYRAELADAEVALKWYFAETATPRQRQALARLAGQGSPDRRFLWPIELCAERGTAGFGYVMPLRDGRMKSIVDLMKGRIGPSFRALATAGFQLADSFLQLHARGLCYRDISFGNVFFDPDTGDVLVCDNDNVGVDGEPAGGVKGTARFMAPEVVRDEAHPSSATDLWSLSVLLFYLFMVHHPLEGRREQAIRCLDLPAMTRLYGTEPLFVFDPADADNRPVPGLQDNPLVFWPLYPQALRDLFTRAFTDGVRQPRDGRVRESEWRGALLRLRDAIYYCAGCGAEVFYDPAALGASGGQPAVCWSCNTRTRLPYRMRLGGDVVMLNHDAVLYPHHVDDARLYDLGRPVAAVGRHPTQPDVWGLENRSGEAWTAVKPDGGTAEVPPGRSVALANGLRVRFGRKEGEVRA